MTTYRGLLCDLDGTLADSEPLHRIAWLEVLERDHDLQFDEHWFEQYIGTSDRYLAADVIGDHDLAISDEDLIQSKQTSFQATMRERGRSFPGIEPILRSIADRFPLAIATNSGRSDTDVVIPALRLDRFTDVVVTATDVADLKPAPDIYLLAAERLGLAPNECIAIEDSPPGGQAAKAAGCYLIGLNENVTGADEVITDNAAALQRAYELLSTSQLAE